jgi:alkylmercury lyase
VPKSGWVSSTQTYRTAPERNIRLAVDAHDRSGGTTTLQNSYAAVCPSVEASPGLDAYKARADEVPAATVATPLSGATASARALTDETARNR